MSGRCDTALRAIRCRAGYRDAWQRALRRNLHVVDVSDKVLAQFFKMLDVENKGHVRRTPCRLLLSAPLLDHAWARSSAERAALCIHRGPVRVDRSGGVTGLARKVAEPSHRGPIAAVGLACRRAAGSGKVADHDRAAAAVARGDRLADVRCTARGALGHGGQGRP